MCACMYVCVYECTYMRMCIYAYTYMHMLPPPPQMSIYLVTALQGTLASMCLKIFEPVSRSLSLSLSFSIGSGILSRPGVV